MKNILIVGLLSLIPFTAAYAGGSDIYPQGFVEDCSYAAVDADFSAKLLQFTGNDVDKQKASKEFSSMCTCLSGKFFSSTANERDAALAYEVYITMVQYNGRVSAPASLRSRASRDISACKIEANKDRVNKGVQKFDKEHTAPKNDLQGNFMKDIRQNLGKDQNEGYLKKADYLSKCMAEKVEEYTLDNPGLKESVTKRVRQNLQAGTFVNVPTDDNNRAVELIVLRVEDNCW